ncbi:flagellar hook-length control protein FliK [Halopseudomonas maritima]|uniref:flagellar hook-length control protein FliK n=1 Tax=Halopseudomonas maritima TaxID=2918528 RepID=UPI001EEBD1E9|nr:flagellar hook-length control protein FliK [Halopseudomonas maritima]UJJ31118.1 flagellar hook-length control protein FliK [Halopseudomonas maritima]
MSPDIRLPPTSLTQPAAPASAAQERSADALVVALQLLRPIDALALLGGEQARAEVIQSSERPNANGQFELLLRISKQHLGTAPATTTLPTSSPQPLPSGSQLLIQAVAQNQLMAALQPSATNPAGPPLTRLDPQQFPPGSQLQARVVEQQPLPASDGKIARYQLVAELVQQSPSQTLLQLTSSRPVAPGTLLNATVGNQGELRVQSAGEQLRQADLLQGLREALQRQGSAEPLLARLQTLVSNPQPLPAVPQLHQAIQNVLNQIVSAPQLTTASGVANAVAQSGAFLESNLAQLANILGRQAAAGSPTATADSVTAATTATTEPASRPANPLPALDKLLPLLASLASPGAAEPLAGADLKGALLGLLVTLQQQMPPGSLQTAGLPPGPWQQAVQAAQQQSAGKPGLFPLPSRALQALGESGDLGSLLRLTAALLSRIQHHQLQSMGQTQVFSDGSTQTTWQLEIPLRDGQQFNHVQMRIQRDSPAPDREHPDPVPVWEVRLAFNLDHLGNLQAIARLRDDRISSELWAEQQSTLALLHSELDTLRDRLLAKGLDVGEISCHCGTPPAPRQAVQQTWIDEVT